ncbi:MAG: hypothetical protein CVU89_13820 [Firmicutes bacterium HGW-Firmicutes-14]|nr:MAG: hypothetical protein CVU89_13820 [Firmicutes bacterium HGW-Firmicutes-14]
MQLSPGEHSILAYFPSSTKAREAARALKQAGFGNIQIDRVGRYGVSNDANYNNPIAGRAGTLTGLTLFSANTDSFSEDDTGVLLGADPSVEGYAPIEYGAAGGRAFLVTVVTETEQLDQAAAILKDKGAYL